jgi:NADH-quinone oxidoreductase subunit H
MAFFGSIAALVAAVVGYGIAQGPLGGHSIAHVVLTVGPALVAIGLASVGVAVLLAEPAYRSLGPIVSRFPGPILISAVIGVCVVVWVVALLFAYVDSAVLGQAAEAGVAKPVPVLGDATTWGYSPAAITSLLERREGLGASSAGLLKYLLWPFQFGIVRDFLGLAGLVGLVNIIPVYTIWWERKVAGRIQSRLGPMRVGGWHGWSQSVADGIKLLLKEDLVPDSADRVLFRAAPYLAMIPAVLAFLALPFGSTYAFRELDVALVFILGVLGVEVVGVIMAGWASNNKWSVYGAMREACQMVSYEIPMGMALLVPVAAVGTLNLRQIGDAQAGGWFTWLAFTNPFIFIAFVSYFIASLASCKRAPFDLPEAESELVAGFHTEYSGLRWSFFFFAEYAVMFVVAGLAAILFLGGWHSPLPAAWGQRVLDAIPGWPILARGVNGLLFSGPLWFVAKCVFLIYVQIWLRWTLPRIRIDQVLYGCVQVLLPLTMIILLGSTLWVWASTSSSAVWGAVNATVNVILGLIGLVFALAFPAIAAYGFYHRRWLVGNLVQDAMPGS